MEHDVDDVAQLDEQSPMHVGAEQISAPAGGFLLQHIAQLRIKLR